MLRIRLSIKLPILIVLAVVITALAANLLAIFIGRNIMRTRALETNINSVQAYSSAISLYLDNARSVLETTANLPEMKHLASALSVSPKPLRLMIHGSRSECKTAELILEHSKVFEYVMLLRPDGGIYHLDPAGLKTKFSHHDQAFTAWYKELMKTSQTVVSNLHISPITQQPTVVIAVPIFSAKGKLVGIWAGGLKLEELSKIGHRGLESEKLLHYGYVTDSRGLIITHQAKLRYVERQTDFSSVPPVRAALTGQQGASQFVNPIEREEELGAYVPLPGAKWAVVYEMPTRIAFEPINSLIRNIALTSIFLAALLCLMSMPVVRKITRPLKQLMAGSERIGAGDLIQRIDVKTGDEIERLADQFNRMAVALSEKETQLRQHTERLEDTNKELEKEITERKRMMEELRTASIYARSLIEASLDPLVTISPEGKITDVNEATIKVTGVPREGLTGTDFSNYFTEPEKAREGYRQVFEKGVVIDYPLTIRHRNGNLVEVLYNASVYKDIRDNVLGVFAAARDVTESKRVVLDLVETKNYLYNILQSSTKYSVIGMDLNHCILSWNEGAMRNYGYTEEEIIGKDAKIIYAPEDIESGAVERFITTAYEKGVAESEFQRVRKDGTRFPASVVITRRNDASGRPIGYLLMSSDIRDKKEAEERLRYASQYARSLIEASLDPLVTINPDGKITDVNEATIKVTGIAREELIGTDLSNYFTEPDKARVVGYREVLEKGFVINYPLTIRHILGTTTDVLYNAAIYRNEAGELQGVFAAARDITELKHAEEEIKKLNEELKRYIIQLESANKELEAFSYSVSHDLRAPLRAIDGFSRIILEDYLDKLDDEGKRVLSVIRNNTQKMGQLIDDLLLFSRLGRQELRASGIDMGKLARAVSEELKLAVPERKLKFNINTLIPAQGDQAMIRQVFVNLLSNAVKFTRPKERAVIEVDGRSEGNENVYTVKDNGVGFDMQYVDKLFGVFQRLHSSEEFEGTGVGLAIVQRIIHRHGGRVWAEGKVGEGATFYFTLPRGTKGGGR